MSFCAKLREYYTGGQIWKPLPQDNTPLLPLDQSDLQSLVVRQNREKNFRRIKWGAVVCLAASAVSIYAKANVVGLSFLAASYTALIAVDCMRCRAIFSRKYHAE